MKELKLSGASAEETRNMIPKGTILLGYMGSHSHGTYMKPTDPDAIDDIDLMGVCILPIEQYLGLGRNPILKKRDHRLNNNEQEIKEGQWDIVVYEIRKFFQLLLKQNPNVLGLLWLPENLYVHASPEGRKIIEARDMFTSKMAYDSFSGYAKDQLYKMTHMAFQGYMGQKRKALVERFGYDCKNASHLIRLLNMGIEYLTDGKLRVFRHDAEILKAIKKGEWSLEKVKAEAERLFSLAQEAYVRSPLPAEPNYAEAEKLLLEIMKTAHKGYMEG